MLQIKRSLLASEEARAPKRGAPEPRTKLGDNSLCDTQSRLAAFWREGKFCDVIVRVDEREFPAHRVALAAGSEYFAALFEGRRFADSTSPIVELKDAGMKASSFEAVLTFLYTGICDCATSELHHVGAAAAFLQVLSLLEVVTNVIRSNVGAKNCIAFWVFATKFALTELADRCWEEITLNFAELGDALRSLPLEAMQSLLAVDTLNIVDERGVLDVALNYARAHQIDDDSTLANFFSGVRFALLSESQFACVMQEPLLAGAQCREMMLRALHAAHVHKKPKMKRIARVDKVKDAGYSAEEAKQMGCDAKRIFPLCRPIELQSTDFEGRQAITDDGKYGRLYAMERDNSYPWHLILDGTNSATNTYTGNIYSRMRLLEWV